MSDRRCYNCGRPGHLSRDCDAPRTESRGRRWNRDTNTGNRAGDASGATRLVTTLTGGDPQAQESDITESLRSCLYPISDCNADGVRQVRISCAQGIPVTSDNGCDPQLPRDNVGGTRQPLTTLSCAQGIPVTSDNGDPRSDGDVSQPPGGVNNHEQPRRDVDIQSPLTNLRDGDQRRAALAKSGSEQSFENGGEGHRSPTTIETAGNRVPRQQSLREGAGSGCCQASIPYSPEEEIVNTIAQSTEVVNTIAQSTEVVNAIAQSAEVVNKIAQSTEANNTITQSTEVDNTITQSTEVNNTISQSTQDQVTGITSHSAEEVLWSGTPRTTTEEPSYSSKNPMGTEACRRSGYVRQENLTPGTDDYKPLVTETCGITAAGTRGRGIAYPQSEDTADNHATQDTHYAKVYLLQSLKLLPGQSAFARVRVEASDSTQDFLLESNPAVQEVGGLHMSDGLVQLADDKTAQILVQNPVRFGPDSTAWNKTRGRLPGHC